MEGEKTQPVEEPVKAAGFSPVGGSGGLSGGYAADTTKEQRDRDHQITELLETYVGAYKSKVKQGFWYRVIIPVLCVLIIGGFAIILGKLSWQLFSAEAGFKAADAVSFITACVSFLTLIIGVLHIITKYFFPEDDEKYITQIVESIQRNDLENRKETARQAERGRSDGPEAPKPKAPEAEPPREDKAGGGPEDQSDGPGAGGDTSMPTIPVPSESAPPEGGKTPEDQ